MKKLKVLYFYSILILLIFSLYSCDQSSGKQRDLQVFRYNEFSTVSSLDPAFARAQSNIWICNQLYNGLVQLDDSLNIKPDLAENWTISNDGLQYQFTIRSNVYFHKDSNFKTEKRTRTVTAADFTYSLTRLKDPKIASPGSWTLQEVDSIYDRVDTLYIRLKKPFPAFLGLLTMKYCSVVPQEIVEAYGSEFRNHPIGTGPFKFQAWKENEKLVLRRNQNYFETDQNGKTLPYLEAVSITFLKDRLSGFMEFSQGKLDFLSGLDPSYKDELLRFDGTLNPKYVSQIDMLKGPYLNTEYLGFYMQGGNELAQSKLLRQAINYGFDRAKMMTYLRNGIGNPAVYGFIPEGLPGFSKQMGYDYNPELARKLLETYRKETGKSLPEITLMTNSNYLDLCEFIQRELEKSGLKIKVDVSPPATLRQAMATGKAPFFRGSWIADYPDAQNYLSLFYSENFAPGGPNYTHFKNENFDKLYRKSFLETHDSIRFDLYQKMDSIIISEAPVVPLYYDVVTRFIQKNVEGLGTNPINLLNLKRVRKVLR
ncbi:MAG: ABC transporter substrate-binding protein [Flavobacteriaceae bacterium]|nr:ABC transporter substrate-binding protein [Flavobacteriaceae bacterium]